MPSAAIFLLALGTHAFGTDVTFRLVDGDRTPVPESVFVIDGGPIVQDGVVPLIEGTHSVTAFPGQVGDLADSDSYCVATVRVAGPTQRVELVWHPARGAGEASGPSRPPTCASIADGHFTLTITEGDGWTYRVGRPSGANAPPDEGDLSIIELAGWTAGLARVVASPGAFESTLLRGPRRAGEEWTNAALSSLDAEAQAFLGHARRLKRDDPELRVRLRSLQDRAAQAWSVMSWPTGTNAPLADGLRRDLAARRLAVLEQLLERIEALLGP
jgi:hypothetical protein